MSPNSSAEAVLAFAFEVKALATDLNGALAAAFRPLGLTCVQAEALLALESLEPATLKQLAEHLVAESGHPSRLVSRLVDGGLVNRQTSTSDARAVTLELTPKGRELAARARTARACLITEFAQRYGDTFVDVTEFIRELRGALAEH